MGSPGRALSRNGEWRGPPTLGDKFSSLTYPPTVILADMPTSPSRPRRCPRRHGVAISSASRRVSCVRMLMVCHPRTWNSAACLQTTHSKTGDAPKTCGVMPAEVGYAIRQSRVAIMLSALIFPRDFSCQQIQNASPIDDPTMGVPGRLYIWGYQNIAGRTHRNLPRSRSPFRPTRALQSYR